MDGIRIEVTGNIARIIERPARITAGTVGLPIEFSFDDQWEGLSKTAVFKAGRTEMIVENLEAETNVPWEATANPGVWLSVGVYGANADGSVAIPTIWANVCVICDGVNPDGDVSTAPTLPVWQRLWNSIGNLLGLTTNAKGNLVEAINEVNSIALAGGIESDTTLTKSGKAADAKAVGDALNTKAASDHKHTASDVGARPDNWMPTAKEVGALPATAPSNSPNCYYRTVDGVDEWINPPMIIGVEYRSTERWNGKPVYVKAVNLGTLSQDEIEVVIPTPNLDVCVDVGGVATNTNGDGRTSYVLPRVRKDRNIYLSAMRWINSDFTTDIYIYQSADASISTFTATVWVKYTKTTD